MIRPTNIRMGCRRKTKRDMRSRSFPYRTKTKSKNVNVCCVVDVCSPSTRIEFALSGKMGIKIQKLGNYFIDLWYVVKRPGEGLVLTDSSNITSYELAMHAYKEAESLVK